MLSCSSRNPLAFAMLAALLVVADSEHTAATV
jgi:hypothetical protein